MVDDGSVPRHPHPGEPSPGPVMLIGGAEDKLKDKVILGRFVQLAGGADGHIVIVSTASSLGEAATELYRLLFTQMGAGRISGLRPLTRDQASDPSLAAELADATGVFLTGGNQLRLSIVVGGTPLGQAILAAHRRGAVVAGTSAGASALSEHMVAFGSSGAIPKHRMAQMSAGLGLIEGVVIDQHFEQRTRIGRLLAVVAQSPSLLGIGLDEDTAGLVDPDGVMEVVGKGTVTIVDGSEMTTDAYRTRAHRPMLVSGAVLHSLPSGSRFDLRTRTLIPAPERGSAARAAGKQELPKATQARLRRMAREIAVEGADSFVVDRRLREEREASE